MRTTYALLGSEIPEIVIISNEFRLKMIDNENKLIRKKSLVKSKRIVALKKQLVYYKEITETIREPFIILSKDLNVVSANLAFYRKFKVSKKETEGRPVYELGDNQWDAPELRELLEHILPKQRVLTAYEITLDFPTLGRKTMLLNARQVDSKQLILLAIQDITAQKMLKLDSDKMTSNLLKQRDQLQSLNDAKDEFIMLASHQLRTPATAIKQYVGMLSQGYAGEVSKDQGKMLDIAYRSNERQLEIIEDLLRVAKVDAGKVYLEKSSYDIGHQVEIAMKEQAILFKNRGQTIKYNPPMQRAVVYGDCKLILMVIENILDNAGKYSQEGSQINIAIEQGEFYTKVSIQDTGVGIRKVDIKKLFEKFVRIDNSLSASVTGTGLGLYWAKKILDLHEGSIEVISKINKGSTFTLKTPTRKKMPQLSLSN
jgi:two-component system CheB/CheR fusion protein